MKNYLTVLLFFGAAPQLTAQHVGIGTATPAASAALDVSSTTRGLLPPRMTASQRNAIATPANGLIVFDTDSAALMVRSAGGWRRLTTTAAPGGFWQVNGANIFNTNAGNVGIGVNDPLFKLDVSGRVLLRGQGAANTSPGIIFSSLNGQEARAMLAMQNDTVLGLFSDYPNIANAGWPLAVNVARGRIGINTSQPQAALHVADSNVLFFAAGEPAAFPFPLAPLAINGPGRRMLWFPGRAAFRVGYAENEWDQDSIGLYSFASGYRSKAIGLLSVAFGELSAATGFGSFAAGSFNKAFSNHATALGLGTTASGFAGTSLGFETVAGGGSSTSMGFQTEAFGESSTSMGSETLASGQSAVAMGNGTLASGIASTAIGTRSQASGISSLATGFETKATNNEAVAFGQLTHASGVGSLASGAGTRAKALSSAAFGRYNDSTDAPNPNATAPGDRIFQIGNGTADNDRRNALTVLRSGQVGIGTVAPKARLHVDGSLLSEAALSINLDAPPPIEGAGIRFMWFPERVALRSGVVIDADAANWNKDSIGIYSVGLGNGVKASGDFSIAMGGSTQARGFASVAFGASTLAEGIQSFASGGLTQAIGNNSTAMGRGTIAKAWGSFAVGGWNDATDNPTLIPALSDRIFQVGSGFDGSPRRNAFTILRNGNIGLGNVNTPNAPLHFNNALQNRKIILYQDVNINDDHRYYGFGIQSGILRYQTDATNASHVFYAGTGATTSNELFRIQGNGNAILAGTLTQNSDATLKKNIEPIADAGAMLSQLNGYRYQWKDENADTEKQLGLLAQEVQKVLPELVKEGENGKLGVNYSGLIPVLLEALKAQQSLNEKQQAMLDKQQAEINTLKKNLSQIMIKEP
jgi:hypothetical protein